MLRLLLALLTLAWMDPSPASAKAKPMNTPFDATKATRIDLPQAQQLAQVDPRPRISVQTSSDEIRVCAELDNPTDRVQTYSFSTGGSPSQLLKAHLDSSPLVAGPPLPANLPIVTPVYFRFDIPPKTRMTVEADPIHLSAFRYDGAPEARIVWAMDFVGAQRMGEVRVKLPKRR